MFYYSFCPRYCYVSFPILFMIDFIKPYNRFLCPYHLCVFRSHSIYPTFSVPSFYLSLDARLVFHADHDILNVSKDHLLKSGDEGRVWKEKYWRAFVDWFGTRPVERRNRLKLARRTRGPTAENSWYFLSYPGISTLRYLKCTRSLRLNADGPGGICFGNRLKRVCARI